MTRLGVRVKFAQDTWTAECSCLDWAIGINVENAEAVEIDILGHLKTHGVDEVEKFVYGNALHWIQKEPSGAG